jgi:hypothetical protein
MSELRIQKRKVFWMAAVAGSSNYTRVDSHYSRLKIGHVIVNDDSIEELFF